MLLMGSAVALLPGTADADTGTGQGFKRPNIIFILADDLGYGDLGAYGQKKIRTPNLDRLAAQGMSFTTHYSGHNVCIPLAACS